VRVGIASFALCNEGGPAAYLGGCPCTAGNLLAFSVCKATVRLGGRFARHWQWRSVWA